MQVKLAPSLRNSYGLYYWVVMLIVMMEKKNTNHSTKRKHRSEQMYRKGGFNKLHKRRMRLAQSIDGTNINDNIDNPASSQTQSSIDRS